ncbi:MAG: hypothetical protein JXR69_10120 [Candidatus Delongbacteria bacterium]|nr:hypothetical protein [Candidatus Delongbacteria bacterium]
MKFLLICLTLFTSLFSQFSSSVDYKELSRKKNSFGLSLTNFTAENQWDTDFINGVDTVKFTGVYDHLGDKIELDGFYYLNEDRLIYRLGFSLDTYSSIIKIDTLGFRERFVPDEKNLACSFGELGYVFGEDEFGGSVGFNLYSIDERKCFIGSVNGFINSKTVSGNRYGADLGYIFVSDDSLRSYVRSNNVISPDIKFGVHYIYSGYTYDLKFYSGLNLFDSEIYEENAYINFSVSYNRSLEKLKTDLLFNVGSNVTSEFDIPEIQLPFLYYGVAVENKFFGEKFRLLIGWRSEMYYAVIGSFDDISEYIPAHYPAMFDLEQTMTRNKLLIEVNYLY